MVPCARTLFPRRMTLVGLLLVVLLIAACSGTPTTGSNTTQQPTAEAEAETPATAESSGENNEESTGDAVQLTYWMSSDPTLEAATDGILEKFTAANPNITVRREGFPFNEYFQKLLTSFSGGSGPDVFWIDVQVAAFADRGVLAPEGELIQESDLAPLLPSALKEGTWDGTLYALPLHQVAEAIFVNKAMAEEAGIRLPTSVEDAWTWDEFVDIAVQLTNPDGPNGPVYGFAQQRHLQDWSILPIIAQNGGQSLSDDLKSATGYLNSPESVEAMQWFQDLFQEHKVIAVDVIPDGFPNGQIAMMQAPSTYHTTLQRNFPDFEYVVVPLFRGSEGCAVMTSGWNVAISATTPNKDEAWKLVQWVTNEGHAEWVEQSGYLPIREDVIAQPKFSEAPWSVFMESLQECAINRPATEDYQFYVDTFNAAAKDIALGGDVQQILDAAAQKLDAELGK